MIDLDLIIFDLDGTLIDSKADIANAVNYMLSQLDIKLLENEIIHSYVGKGVARLIKCSITDNNLDKFDKAIRLFRDYYLEHLMDNTTVYPNVNSILKYFGGKKKAIVTNKDERYTSPIINDLGLLPYFDKIICGDTTSSKKPNPEPLNAVINQLGVERDKTLIVGDGSADIEAGRRANIHTCGLTGGFGSREELVESEAHIIIDDIAELKDYYL